MTKLIPLIALFLGSVSHANSSTLGEFRAHFKEYVGHYQLIGCSNSELLAVNKEVKKNEYCDRKYVNVFFGNSYKETPDGPILFFTLSNTGVEPTPGIPFDHSWVGIDLASDPEAYDDTKPFCTTIDGSQTCQDTSGGSAFIEQGTLTRIGDLVYLHKTLSYPNQDKNFFYSDMLLVLKKVSKE
jgi:hypothetical protein